MSDHHLPKVFIERRGRRWLIKWVVEDEDLVTDRSLHRAKKLAMERFGASCWKKLDVFGQTIWQAEEVHVPTCSCPDHQ